MVYQHRVHSGVVVTEADSHLRLIDPRITQLEARGPSRTCTESKEEEEALLSVGLWGTFQFVGLGNVLAGSQSAMWSTNIGSTSTCFDVADLGLALAREPGGGGEA